MSSGINMLFKLIFSSIGLGYAIYGKRQQKSLILSVGIGLCSYAYLFKNTLLIIVIGLGLTVIPFFIKE